MKLGEQRPIPDEYWWVYLDSPGLVSPVCVTAETARRIEALLDLNEPPEWITCRELSGSRVRIRTRLIGIVCESTPAQRELECAFIRAKKAEKDWSVDE